jgi:hypothetical protein
MNDEVIRANVLVVEDTILRRNRVLRVTHIETAPTDGGGSLVRVECTDPRGEMVNLTYWHEEEVRIKARSSKVVAHQLKVGMRLSSANISDEGPTVLAKHVSCGSVYVWVWDKGLGKPASLEFAHNSQVEVQA